MAEADGDGDSRARRTPLVVTFVVMALIGAMYYGYYRTQVAYFTGRNLRLLAMLTAQIDGQLQTLLGIKEQTKGQPAPTIPSLDDVLRPVLARRVQETFDIFLVAESNGVVLKTLQPPANSSSLLYRSDDDEDQNAAKPATTRSPVVLTTLKALEAKKGWREYGPLDPGRLAASTSCTSVAFNGDDYLLFSQPFYVDAKVSLDGKPHQWILCGLVSASRFRYDVSALSATVVLIGMALALLAICCWPFLRIALIGPSQALTIGDVVLIVLCTIVGAGVLTLAAYDVFAYRTISASADSELQKFAETTNDDFGNDVSRAMTALTRLQELTAGQPPGSSSFNAAWANDPVAGCYPYLDTLYRIDAKGMQVVKFANGAPTPLVSVDTRRYFQDALANRTWTVNGQEYVLEWVRSKTTGEPRAVLAKQTGDPALPVIALSTELIDVTHAIRPPGVDLAFIDEDGSVVYHSDMQRIGYENFFAETDRNRELRSAVIARRAGFVGAKYWGEDTSMYVQPLKGSPWTLVAFRAKRLTRVLNVEGALLTLLMVSLTSTPYLLVYILVLILTPGYRAPRLWPDAKRGDEYFRLVLVLLALLVLFWVNNFVLTPWSAFFGAVFLPLIAILSTYLALHRKGAPWRFAVGTSVWLIAIAIYLGVCLIPVADVDSGLVFSSYPRPTKAALVVLTLLVAGVTMLLLSGWSGGTRIGARLDRLRARAGYGVWYRLCGVLLLTIGVVMPVTSFFTISRHVESELLRKYCQLRAAADLEHRIERLASMSAATTILPEVVRDISTPQLQSPERFIEAWALQPPPAGAAPVKMSGPECAASNDKDWTVPRSAANWLPAFYEDSVAIRPLFAAGAADDLWFWCLKDRFVKLVRRIRLDPAVAAKVWGKVPAEQSIVILSGVPQGVANWTDHLLMFLIALPLLLVFWYATDFIARRVLLIDVEAPRWLANLPLSPTLGDHIFLVRRDRDASAVTGPQFLDVSFEELEKANGWDAALQWLDSSTAGHNVRIPDFEYGINDAVINEKKLQWLERLLALPDRTVIIVSSVSAAYVTTTPMPAEAVAQWRAVLGRFVIVTADELELRASERETSNGWLEHETEYNSFLTLLRRELDHEASRRQLLDELGERAEAYFAGLWASCRDEEKLLLYHIARNGLANARNRRVLRRVLARGLVRRDPNVELFSETFRLYVLNAAKREDLAARARAERSASTWDTLRIPFFVVIVAFLLLLFATQKDLMTTTTALVTALTTGLPMLMKLLGMFTERRLDAGK